MRHWWRLAVAAAATAVLLGGCQKISKERQELRTAGIACMESGDYAGAVERFDLAVADANRVSDFETDVLKYRGEAEYRLLDYAAAAHTYGILNQLEKKKPEYLYLEAICLARENDAAGAEGPFAAAEELDAGHAVPGYAEAVMALGGMYREQKENEKAEAMYTELLNSGAATAAVYDGLAMARMETGDYENALTYLERGLALESGAEEKKTLFFHRAVCYEYLGEFQTALSYFNEYVASYGSDGAAEHEIAFLTTR